MTMTYEGPLANEKDKYRFLVGDTDIENAILYDEEILFVIAHVTKHNTRLIMLYTRLLNHYMTLAKSSLGPESEDYTETIRTLQKTIVDIKKSNSSSGTPYSAKSKQIFSKGMHDIAR